jgi:hypothetical protein
MLTTGLTQEPAPNAPKGFGLWTVASALSATHSRAYSGAQQRRGGFVSNLLTLIRAAKSWGLGRTEKSKRGSNEVSADSAFAKKTAKHCARAHFHSCCRTNTVDLTIFSAAADRIRVPFRVSGPTQHPWKWGLITYEGKTQFATRIWDVCFLGNQHVAGHLNFLYDLSNSKSFSSSVSWFWTDTTASTLENTCRSL